MPADGKPHTPTLHPRTRPEGNEWAYKNRQTNDWFRHDGENVEQQKRLKPKLHTEKAIEIANKAKGIADEWFAHNKGNQPIKNQKKPRCPSAESLRNSIKNGGKNEYCPWYKFDDNQNYHTPRPQHRLTEKGGFEVKERAKGLGKDWYRHEHDDDGPKFSCKNRSPTKECKENLTRMTTGADWFVHGTAAPIQNGNVRNQNGYSNSEADEFKIRNKTGTATSWFNHDHNSSDEDVNAYPIIRQSKGTLESESWFGHDNPPAPVVKYKQTPASQMQKVLTQENSNTEMYADYANRIKPEAREYAEKSVKGMLSKILNQENANSENNATNDVVIHSRAVKPEAQKTFEKNKGIMSSLMEGHPIKAPVKKHQARTVKGEASVTASNNMGGHMAKILDEEKTNKNNRQPATPQQRGAPRGLPAEARGNAEKNKGTMGAVFAGSLELAGKAAPKLASNSGRMIAMKHRGTAGPLIFSQPVGMAEK